MSDKPRYPRAEALTVASRLLEYLEPCCTKIAVAGSLRRGRADVGDVELVYVPRFGPHAAGPGDLFPDERTRANLADVRIQELLEAGLLAKRPLANGRTAFGAQNKLMLALPQQMPVDLFATSEECWSNYLVCRTGGAETNKAIAAAALRKGWQWNPYGPGFSRELAGAVELHAVTSEADVFAFVGLPYLEPEQRN